MAFRRKSDGFRAVCERLSGGIRAPQVAPQFPQDLSLFGSVPTSGIAGGERSINLGRVDLHAQGAQPLDQLGIHARLCADNLRLWSDRPRPGRYSNR